MTKLMGIIEFVKRVKIGKHICYGATYADGDKFRIKISRAAGESVECFVETLIHEMLHLAFYIISGVTKVELSDREHHRLINKIMKVALKEIRSSYVRRVK
jgi:predicted SprT family Zn-dependent metalloprotease